MVQIFWKDLTAEKQQEIIEEFGDNCNFDVVPVAEIDFADDEDEENEEDDDLLGWGDNDE